MIISQSHEKCDPFFISTSDLCLGILLQQPAPHGSSSAQIFPLIGYIPKLGARLAVRATSIKSWSNVMVKSHAVFRGHNQSISAFHSWLSIQASQGSQSAPKKLESRMTWLFFLISSWLSLTSCRFAEKSNSHWQIDFNYPSEAALKAQCTIFQFCAPVSIKCVIICVTHLQ